MECNKLAAEYLVNGESIRDLICAEHTGICDSERLLPNAGLDVEILASADTQSEDTEHIRPLLQNIQHDVTD